MLRTDPNTNDLDFLGGLLIEVANDAEERGQMIRERLLTVQGEWFLNTAVGLDYPGVIWKKQTPKAVRDAHIKRQILKSAGPGSEIRSYETTLSSSRVFTLNSDVLLTSGEVTTVTLG